MNNGHRLHISTLAVLVALILFGTGVQESLASEAAIYVDADAVGANDGSSWVDAFTTLQPALDAANSGDQIWVAAGTYKPTSEHGGTGDRYRSYQLKNGVALYGGFDPTFGVTIWDDRDWISHLTILSGDIGVPGSISDNSYHVFYHTFGIGLDSSAILDGFTIEGGNANGPHFLYYHDLGAGMYNYASSPTLTNVIFTDNEASGNGGGMYNWNNSSPVLTNVTFAGNSAVGDGGGLYNNNASPVLTNCTFTLNSAASGGGLYNYAGAAPVLTNCILWGDTPAEIYNSDSSPVVTYSDIQGGCGTIPGNICGAGNLNADPLLVDAANGDFHLGHGSPCIDAGDNAAPNLPLDDFEGDARIQDGDGDETATVDMGADEYNAPPSVLYVDWEADGANDGTSWEDAFTDLQPALSWALNGVEIWVAEGTYRPSEEISLGDPRSASFQMKNGVEIYGGFDPSVGDSGWADRDWINHITILSGDLGNPGDSADNSYHVFYHPSGIDLNTSAILDGFTITDGNADGHFIPFHELNQGGGMYNEIASPLLSHVTFEGNTAAGNGGGMFNSNGSPTLIDCTFLNNVVWTFEGGGGGGGMFNAGSPTLSNCHFSGNSAFDYGGGMANSGGSPTLTNCTFSGNYAEELGGGMYNSNSSPILTNCTFAGNDGGGIYALESMLTVTNSILWGNTPYQLSQDLSTVSVTFSDVQGGYLGTGNIAADPLFVDPSNGDYHLGIDSPCIDVGDNNGPILPPYDFEGDARIQDGDSDGTATVDMGVDEVDESLLWLYIYLPVVLRSD